MVVVVVVVVVAEGVVVGAADTEEADNVVCVGELVRVAVVAGSI